jgi:hypothetical protein
MEARTTQKLHIFVNGIKYDDDRVKPQMTGAEIAALADVTAGQARIRYDTGPNHGQEIAIDQTIDIHQADHFIVTRKEVQGGARL